MLRGKLIALNAYIKGKKIYYLCFHLNKLEKDEQIKPKVKEKNENRNEICEIENRQISKINKVKNVNIGHTTR